MRIKILLVDDHELVRIGISQLLIGTEFKVVAESSSPENLTQQINDCDADLVLLDVRIGDQHVFRELSRVRQELPDVPILMMSAFDNPTYIHRAIELRAAGYVLKSVQASELIAIMQTVIRENFAWSSDDLRRVSGAMATPRLELDSGVALTRRENEVLLHVVRGLTNKEIAGELHISYETVKEHVQHLLRKIGVSDRTQAAVWAVRKGLA